MYNYMHTILKSNMIQIIYMSYSVQVKKGFVKKRVFINKWDV